MEPLPYNITISAQSAAISYSPSRFDNSDWNVTYSHGTTSVSPFGNQGIGDSYLQTTSTTNPSLSFTWIGTAIYLYGNSTTNLMIKVDDTIQPRLAIPDSTSNLLANVTDLPYGSHTITFTRTLLAAASEPLVFHHAVLTVGIGYEGSSFQIQNRSVSAFLDNQPNDAFFAFHKSTSNEAWSLSGLSYLEKILPDGGREPVPLALFNLARSSTSPILTFTVANASAFFMRGFVGGSRHSKIATLTPGLNGSASKVTVFDDFSSILDYDQILYWESGLDRDQSYTVDVYGNTNGDSGFLDFHTLDIIDGGPDPSKQTQLSAASIAGIAVGAALSIIILAMLALYWRLRRRRNQAALEIAGAANISPFVGTKSDSARRAGPGMRSKRHPIHEPEPHGVPPSPSSESNPNPGPPPSISASVTRRALRHLRRLRFTSPPSIHEVDAGPVTLPPRYDHSWAANAEPVPALAASRRVVPIPPGPTPPNFNEDSQSERNSDSSSS